MNTFRNKFVSAALSAGMLLSTAGVALPVAHAQSVADLSAQIAALLAQIQQLQAQLNAAQGGGAAASCSFSRDLTVGSSGDDVLCLQRYLNGAGYQVAASGAGSPGSESNYFGSRSQAALAKWQAAMGVSPAAGYFGSISRAKYSSLAAGAPAAPGVPQLPAPSAGLRVGLAADNPAAGSLISGSSAAARVPVLAVNLTAGVASGITVSELRFKKLGVLSDSSISGAYVVENGRVLSQYNSISGGVLTFSGLSLSIAAGQTRRLELAIDPATNLTAGNTVSFGMNAAADVVAVDAGNNSVVASGAFPLSGNLFTVTSVSNPSLASLTIASSSIGTEVTAGTNNNLVGAWSFTVSNSKAWLKAVTFKVIGSANKTDLRNVVLKVNGNAVGSALAQVASNGDAFFDASASPGVLNTGANNIQLFADIAGSPSFNFQFEILNAYDVLVVDSQYNVPISAASNTGTQVSIKAGTITVSQATDSPTGNIAPGQSSVTLAKFTVFAGGEALKVRWLGAQLIFTGFTDNTIDDTIKNLSLIDDAGGQVGTTVNTLSTSVSCNNGSASPATITNTTGTSWTYTNCFGNSSSPINYVVPANTTRVLSLRGDVQSGASFTTLQGALVAESNNLQGLTSSQLASSASVSGAARTLASASLSVAKNTAVGDQTLAKNATGLRIGSYALSASSAEGVTVNNISVIVNGGSWSNAKLMVSGVQFGSTQGTVASGTTYSFSGSPFTIAAGQTKYLDVYADSLSSASGSVSPASVLSGCSASGASSLTALSCTSTNGQAITFAGQSTIAVAIDSATPAARQLVMGSSGNSFGVFRFTETSNVEDVKITDLYVFQQVAATNTVKAAFGSLGVYSSAGSLLASAGSATTYASTSNPGPGYYYKFSFASPVVVPRAGSISLTLKGDVASYSSSGATDNTTHVFKIATLGADSALDANAEIVVALGATSNASSAVSSLPAAANAATVLRSRLSVSASPLGTTSGRARTAVDDLADVTFAADSAGGVQIGSVKITFSGSAPAAITFASGTITVAATGTTVGTYSVVVNGFTVTTPSEPTSTSKTQIATDITTAINASTSVVGVTATSTAAVSTLTAT
ncbi:hypothetical protein HY418_02750, partial [Candidatus Kaiserbacteria bacterium]|nr:hypothetical protein [Candidatus Kaiserbacteria bacterium]